MYREQRAVGSRRCKWKIRGAQCPVIPGCYVNHKRFVDNCESNAPLIFPMPFSSIDPLSS